MDNRIAANRAVDSVFKNVSDSEWALFFLSLAVTRSFQLTFVRSPLNVLVFLTLEALDVGFDDVFEAAFEVDFEVAFAVGLTTVCETALLTAFLGARLLLAGLLLTNLTSFFFPSLPDLFDRDDAI